jgi:hypothetical protein
MELSVASVARPPSPIAALVEALAGLALPETPATVVIILVEVSIRRVVCPAYSFTYIKPPRIKNTPVGKFKDAAVALQPSPR